MIDKHKELQKKYRLNIFVMTGDFSIPDPYKRIFLKLQILAKKYGAIFIMVTQSNEVSTHIMYSYDYFFVDRKSSLTYIYNDHLKKHKNIIDRDTIQKNIKKIHDNNFEYAVIPDFHY